MDFGVPGVRLFAGGDSFVGCIIMSFSINDVLEVQELTVAVEGFRGELGVCVRFLQDSPNPHNYSIHPSTSPFLMVRRLKNPFALALSFSEERAKDYKHVGGFYN